MGILGFLDHSLISLIASTISAIIILFCLAWAKSNPRAARITTLVIAVYMTGKFSTKAIGTPHQIYPAGIMFVCSIIVVICLAAGHMIGMKQKKAREAAEKKA